MKQLIAYSNYGHSIRKNIEDGSGEKLSSRRKSKEVFGSKRIGEHRGRGACFLDGHQSRRVRRHWLHQSLGNGEQMLLGNNGYTSRERLTRPVLMVQYI
jgi:hypothetical protein